MQNSSIWPKDRTLSGATTLGHSGPGSDGNEVNKGVILYSLEVQKSEPQHRMQLMSYLGYFLYVFLFQLSFNQSFLP